MRGQFGGVYFKHSPDGQHIQAMPRHVYNTFGGTPPPYVHGSGFSRKAYINSWTYTARMYALFTGTIIFADWVIRSCGWEFPEGKAKGKKMPPYIWWQYLNVPRVIEGLPAYTYPPKGPNPRYPDEQSRGIKIPNFTVIGKFFGFQTINNYAAAYHGTYNGKPYYNPEPTNTHCCLWWSLDRWILSNSIGEFIPPWWYNVSEDPVGFYEPSTPEYGTLIVNY